MKTNLLMKIYFITLGLLNIFSLKSMEKSPTKKDHSKDNSNVLNLFKKKPLEKFNTEILYKLIKKNKNYEGYLLLKKEVGSKEIKVFKFNTNSDENFFFRNQSIIIFTSESSNFNNLNYLFFNNPEIKEIIFFRKINDEIELKNYSLYYEFVFYITIDFNNKVEKIFYKNKKYENKEIESNLSFNNIINEKDNIFQFEDLKFPIFFNSNFYFEETANDIKKNMYIVNFNDKGLRNSKYKSTKLKSYLSEEENKFFELIKKDFQFDEENSELFLLLTLKNKKLYVLGQSFILKDNKEIFWINNFSINDNFIGCGLGKKFMETITNDLFFNNKKLEKIYLDPYDSVIGFYTKFGFVKENNDKYYSITRNYKDLKN